VLATWYQVKMRRVSSLCIAIYFGRQLACLLCNHYFILVPEQNQAYAAYCLKQFGEKEP
jgi:hypothetical protein